MNCKYTTLFRVWTLGLLVHRVVCGQPAGAPRTIQPLAAVSAASAASAASTAPIVTLLAAASGVLVRSLGAGNASLDLGGISYFKGSSASGESSAKTPNSFVVTTRFALKVDCPGHPAGSRQVSVSMSRLDASSPYAMSIDGISLGITERTLAPSLPCGSESEHRLEVEVPVAAPPGSIGSTVAFVATLRN